MRNILCIPSGAFANGGVEGCTTEKRLQAALEKSKEIDHPVTFVPSGGKLRATSIQPDADADIMSWWLVDNGVKRDRVSPEDKAADTFENIRFTARRADEFLEYWDQEQCKLWVFSGKGHLRRFKWGFWWLNLFRIIRRKKPFVMEYEPSGEKVSWFGWVLELLLFLIVHVPDPLGYWHPVALIGRYKRRANGRKP
ncbi:MAG TPA: YdcF family protein [Verrucomicrobiae bacterium]|nr:YdcF family protein [Verrucomicrobiae bacterium]